MIKRRKTKMTVKIIKSPNDKIPVGTIKRLPQQIAEKLILDGYAVLISDTSSSIKMTK